MPLAPGRPGPAPPAFRDRYEAGRTLASMLLDLKEAYPVVLALPRGGVPVGFEVAKALAAPLDLLLVRKLAVPGHPEESLGVAAEEGFSWIDERNVWKYQVPRSGLDEVFYHESQEVGREAARYRAGRPRIELRDRTVILVDDGAATGRSLQVAWQQVRQQAPARVVIAAAVMSSLSFRRLSELSAEVYAAIRPEVFQNVGVWFQNYDPVPVEEVEHLLHAVHELHDQGALPDRSQMLVTREA